MFILQYSNDENNVRCEVSYEEDDAPTLAFIFKKYAAGEWTGDVTITGFDAKSEPFAYRFFGNSEIGSALLEQMEEMGHA
jgi:hypothetical protein